MKKNFLKSLFLCIVKKMNEKEISIAPMLSWTDRHFRFFLRKICRHVLLYTEMINEHALIMGDKNRFLAIHSEEHPIALQIGGSNPKLMSQCAAIAQTYGFQEVNINVGCPSSKVQAGTFGACLMAHPEVVARCIEAMATKTTIPITVKTRIALEGPGDGYEELYHFIQTTQKAGCQKFIIHARKARLKGFSPKENREKIPLNYPLVYKIKQEFPELKIILNGNIISLSDINLHLKKTDGVMIGRHAYINPYFLASIDSLYYQDLHAIPSRKEIIEGMIPYLEDQIKKGIKIHSMTRHMMGLYYQQPQAKKFKQVLRQNNLEDLKKFLHS